MSAVTSNEKALLGQVKQLTKGLLISSLLNAILFSCSLYLYMQEYPVALILPENPPPVAIKSTIQSIPEEKKAPFLVINQTKPSNVEVFRSAEKKIEEKVKPKLVLAVSVPKKENPMELSTPAVKTYLVKTGDTLWKVSKKLHVDIVTLRELNNLQSSDLKPGTTIKLP